jgi:uncharacterized protein (DUF1778 family)
MPTKPAQTSYARLSCRVSAHIKHQAEEAASVLGQSITDFTEAALADKAHAVLERNERITLSERDFAKFVASLENPKPPTAALRETLTEYFRLKADHPESNL